MSTACEGYEGERDIHPVHGEESFLVTLHGRAAQAQEQKYDDEGESTYGKVNVYGDSSKDARGY